jgi:hypothetical protein
VKYLLAIAFLLLASCASLCAPGQSKMACITDNALDVAVAASSMR